MTLEGLDISVWQEKTPPLEYADFVFVRACYGTGLDGRYAMHAANVRKAGRVLGAYAFGVHDLGETVYRSPVEQAEAFLAIADTELLFLDLEEERDKDGNLIVPPMSDAEAALFIAAVHQAGKRIGLYHSRSGYPTLGQDWNFVAQWGGTAPSIPWAFWQYAVGNLDYDKFNGDLDDLRRLAGLEKPVFDATRLKPAIAVHCKPGGTLLQGDPDSPTASIPKWAGGGALLLGTVVSKAGVLMACFPSTSWSSTPVLAFYPFALVQMVDQHKVQYRITAEPLVDDQPANTPTTVLTPPVMV